MDSFSYTALPAKVIFGSGTRERVAVEIAALGCTRALVLTTPTHAAQGELLSQLLGPLSAGVHAGALMHTPVDATQRALAEVAARGPDCLVAIGGGSTIGLSKAIALRTDLPQIVLPTTYAGSEATPIIGQTENGVKTTQRTLRVLPEVIVYDVDLTLTLPFALSVTSGINSMAHAVEALYAKDRNPIISLLAQECVRRFASALPRLRTDPRDLEARGDALLAAWSGGVCLGAVGMSLHHKLCHVLGGTFNLPHAETHAVVLPHAVAYNAPAAPAAMLRVSAALGGRGSAASSLFDFGRSLGAPASLRELGMRADQLDQAVDAACAAPYWNPRSLERDGIRKTLSDALEGRRPG